MNSLQELVRAEEIADRPISLRSLLSQHKARTLSLRALFSSHELVEKYLKVGPQVMGEITAGVVQTETGSY